MNKFWKSISVNSLIGAIVQRDQEITEPLQFDKKI
jgi:hypothetical protein